MFCLIIRIVLLVLWILIIILNIFLIMSGVRFKDGLFSSNIFGFFISVLLIESICCFLLDKVDVCCFFFFWSLGK